MNTTQAQLFYRLWVEHDHLNVTIAAQGFDTTSPMRTAMHQSESIYTDVIHYPQLMNFYAAQKVALQLDADLQAKFLGPDNQRLSVQIPIVKSVPLAQK